MLNTRAIRLQLLIPVFVYTSMATSADKGQEADVKKALDKAAQITTVSLDQAAQTQAPAVQPSSSSSSSVSGSAYGPELHSLYQQYRTYTLESTKYKASYCAKYFAAFDPQNKQSKNLLLHEAAVLSMHHGFAIAPLLTQSESSLITKLTEARQVNWNKEKERLTALGTPEASIQAQEKIVQQYISREDLLQDARPQTPFWVLYKSASLSKDSLFLQYEKQLALEVITDHFTWLHDATKNKLFGVCALQEIIPNVESLQLPELAPIVEKAKKDLTSLTAEKSS